MCGVVGIYGHPEAANLAYLGLYALQHRGQESAGIVATDGEKLRAAREMGHVNDIFTGGPAQGAAGLRGHRPRPLLDRGRLIQEERAAHRGRLRGRLGGGRPQRQPGQRGRAARAARGGRRDLLEHLRHRGHRSSHRPLARADAPRSRRRRASPGPGRLLAGVSDRGHAGGGARSDGFPAARARQVQGHLGGLVRDLRVRAARGQVRARRRARGDGDHRQDGPAQRAAVRRAAAAPLRVRVGLLRAPRLDHRRPLRLPGPRADGAAPGHRARGRGRRRHPGARLGRGGGHRLRARERHPLRPGADARRTTWGARSSSRRSRSATSG